MAKELFSKEEARRFYDHFGSKQDRQAFYEDKALTNLIENSAFRESSRLIEFGCGTGRFAENLLSNVLPDTASYTGFDISATMVSLAQDRLAEFGGRATATQSNGSTSLPVPDGAGDRFISNYVLDLLPPDIIQNVLREAWRVLVPGGYICLTGITNGINLPSYISAGIWRVLHSIRPALVGGCRPVDISAYINPDEWLILHNSKIVSWAIPSEVLVAEKLSGRQAEASY